ncbi:Phage-related lysozyme (muraminidase) [Serratia ficaria]|nr:Phage-related lysozyme (muraminidase) [Serratia ficaria]
MSISKKTGAAGAACSVMVIIGLVLSSGSVKTSQAGLELIGNAEGCQRDPYQCPADVWTDGIGNTHGVTGARKSDEQIAADWERNILDAEQCVNRYAAGAKLPHGAFDAAVSITFNAGCSTMKTSTMFRLFRQGATAAACDQFPRWVYAGGQKLKGLQIRRNKERALCLSK